MKLKVLPYKIFSEGAKDIAKSLNVKRIRPTGNYKPKNSTLVINWGNSKPNFNHSNWMNNPLAIGNASNKLKAFNLFKQNNVSIPQFTTDRTVAQTWLNNGLKVVERYKLSGTNGEGIKVVKPGESLGYPPLYVLYQKKDKEYRVHVFGGKVIDVTEKRKRSGVESTNPYVRNLQNGWVYCRMDVRASDLVKSEAIKAVASLGLDFGAVDVIEKAGKVFILEVNCAPGLQGMTLTKYVEAIKGLLNNATPTRRYSYY